MFKFRLRCGNTACKLRQLVTITASFRLRRLPGMLKLIELLLLASTQRLVVLNRLLVTCEVAAKFVVACLHLIELLIRLRVPNAQSLDPGFKTAQLRHCLLLTNVLIDDGLLSCGGLARLIAPA